MNSYQKINNNYEKFSLFDKGIKHLKSIKGKWINSIQLLFFIQKSKDIKYVFKNNNFTSLN